METVTGFSASLLQGLSGDTEAAASIADMALTDMSDNANKMGTNMESIQNTYQGFAKQNYTMLDNLKRGYGGTKTEMERLLADAQKLTGIEYDIDNLADVYEAIPDVLASIPEILTSIDNVFSEWDWDEIGNNIVSGIANGITAGAGAIWQAAKNAASTALRSAKEFLGIASPSKVMRDQVGKYIPSGLAVGIENNTKPLTDAMHSLSDLTTDTMTASLNFDGSAVSAAVPGYSYGDNNVTIHVYAAENQDVDELAEILMNKIQFAISRREVSFAR